MRRSALGADAQGERVTSEPKAQSVAQQSRWAELRSAVRSALTPERLALAIVAAIGLWLCLMMPVFTQEAYYWSYAQNPDLCYFDHPPLLAWMIAVGTWVFGDGPLGIRIGTLCLGYATMLLGLSALRAFSVGDKGRVRWIAATVIVPAIFLNYFLVLPDSPLSFFWMLAFVMTWRARDGGLWAWIGVGAAVGGALLSKYTGAFLAASVAVVTLGDKRLRVQLKRPGPYLAAGLAVLMFSPVVVWNIDHNLASFRFQVADRYAQFELTLRYFLQYVGGQSLMAQPLLMGAVVASVLWMFKRLGQRDARCTWVLAFVLPLAGFIAVNSFWMQVKINWIVPVYAPLFVGVVMWSCEGATAHRRAHTLAAKAAVAFSAVIVLLAPLVTVVPGSHRCSWAGWPEVAGRVAHWHETLEHADGNAFVFTFDDGDSAQLWRALAVRSSKEAAPELPPVLAQNVIGLPALQFDLCCNVATFRSQNAVLVDAYPEEPDSKLDLARRAFKSVDLVEHVVARRLGVPVLRANVYLCRNYLHVPLSR